jgi:hypothetical protein
LPAAISSTFLFRDFLRLFVAIIPPITSYSLVTPELRSAQAEGPLISPFLSFQFFFYFPPFPFAFLLLFIDIGSILNHPESYEKHHTRH